jgi:hypothetical protein
MLIGHYAAALTLSRTRPSLRLWHLFVATQLVDLGWAVFIWLGIEHARIVPRFTPSNDLDLYDMPYTHSVVATVVWSGLAFLVWRFVRRGRTRTGDALVIALAVASHFVLDLIVHVRDLPVLSAQGTKLGFGLWQHFASALLLETSLVAAAALFWWWPRRATPHARRAGIWLIAMTTFAAASFFIPTPPTSRVLALISLILHGACAALAGWAEGNVAATPAASPFNVGPSRAKRLP